METLQQEPPIKCDFTPPEISLEAFRSHRTDETLADSLSHNPIVNALLEAYERPDDVTSEELRQLEHDAIRTSAELLRECQRYSLGNKPWEEKKQGDCYAYAWLMSDITELLQMKSMIAFCNGHAFNIIQGQSGELHMINGESKHMWLHDLDNNIVAQQAFSGKILSQIKEIQDGQPLTCSLQTVSLRHFSDRNQKSRNKVMLPWLEDHVPAIKIMAAADGKRALFAYSCHEAAIQKGDLAEIGTALNGISDCSPQAETREKINPELKEFKKLVKRWSADSNIPKEDIIKVIETYKVIMPETKSMMIFVGDCLRSIGTSRKDTDSLMKADEMYVEAERKNPKQLDVTLEGKRMKTHKLLADSK